MIYFVTIKYNAKNTMSISYLIVDIRPIKKKDKQKLTHDCDISSKF